jgi:endoglucanase
MKTIHHLIILIALFSVLISCQKEKTNTLVLSTTKIEFLASGSQSDVTIQTDATSWSIENKAKNWVTLSATSGTQNEAKITLCVLSKTLVARKDTLIFRAGNATPARLVVSQASSEYMYELSADKSDMTYNSSANSVSLMITADCPEWSLSCEADWVKFSRKTGPAGTTSVNISITENSGTAERSANIVLSAKDAPTTKITITQKGNIPNYNTNPVDPDINGMGSTAMEIAKKITSGCNIGNTLEAIGGETNWGNPMITNDYVKLLKQSGFNAIRLPCSWSQYADQTSAKIKDSWLARVKEVVGYCVNNDMYVILNIHWDGGWLENNCTEAKKEENNKIQKAYWQQIATQLRDFDEHLLFASANEPNVSDATQMAVLLSYHQTFVDAVRSTGGKNAYRVLVVQGPNTDVETTNKLMNQLPTDQIPNRMMVEIHYYSPWNFTGMEKDETWGNMFYYWGASYHSTTDLAHNPTWGEETYVDTTLKLMKTQFVDKGIPVVMGEYGSMLRTKLTGDALKLHKDSRAYYFKYVTKQAKANGILPFFWEAGGDGAIFNRTNNTVKDQQALDALIQGAAQ